MEYDASEGRSIALVKRYLDGEYSPGDFYCSKCHAFIEKEMVRNHYLNYCYHCGAKFKGNRGNEL